MTFMTKELSKAIMHLNLRTIFNKRKYNEQGNYCVSLLRRTKKNYFNNLNEKALTNNKMFWKTVKPLFSN